MSSSPGDLPQRVYGWGQPDFNAELALDRSGQPVRGLRFPGAACGETPAEDGRRLCRHPGPLPPLPPVARASVLLRASRASRSKPRWRFGRCRRRAACRPAWFSSRASRALFPLEIQLHPKVRMRIRAGTNAGGLFGSRSGRATSGFVIRSRRALRRRRRHRLRFRFHPAAPVVLFGDRMRLASNSAGARSISPPSCERGRRVGAARQPSSRPEVGT